MLLICLTTIGSSAMHIFLPSLPQVAREFGASAGTAQLTITLYLAGTAVGQLIYGPLSDRYGRRPVLLWGMLLFIAATLICTIADSAGQLIAMRVAQALGACACMVLGRAMVRDGVHADQAATALAYVSMATVVAPGLGPAVAGFVQEWVGWRFNFYGIAVLAAVALGAAILSLPETFPDRPPVTHVARMFTDFGRLMRMPVFVGYALCGGVGTGSFFAMVTSMPFLLGEQLQSSTGEMGLYFALASFGFMAGSFIAARLSMRVGGQRMMLIGVLCAMTAATTMLGLALGGVFTVAALMAPFTAVTLSNGICQPNAVASALGADTRMIGAASGLYGFLQMAIGTLGTWLVAQFQDGTQLPVVWCIVICAIVQAAFFYIGWRARNRAGLA